MVDTPTNTDLLDILVECYGLIADISEQGPEIDPDLARKHDATITKIWETMCKQEHVIWAHRDAAEHTAKKQEQTNG